MKPATIRMPPALDKVSKDLRSAVMTGDHLRAGRFALEYTNVAQQVWESLSEAERAASTLPVTAAELFTWAREMTIAQRALAADHLVLVQKIIRYQHAARGRTPYSSVHLRG